MKDIPQIILMASMVFMGACIGYLYKGQRPGLRVVAQNSGVCAGCGAATLVTIKEREKRRVA